MGTAVCACMDDSVCACVGAAVCAGVGSSMCMAVLVCVQVTVCGYTIVVVHASVCACVGVGANLATSVPIFPFLYRILIEMIYVPQTLALWHGDFLAADGCLSSLLRMLRASVNFG